MLKYIYGSQLENHPVLADTMFRDRATQFRDRLGWDVRVDAQGYERDEYDDEDPLYVIWQRADGTHGGSMRFLPTMGPTMINDHFGELLDGKVVRSPFIWECTRFCLAPGADGRVAAALVLGGAEVGRGFGISQCVGVFDARMVRIYRMIGNSPNVLGSSGEGREQISVGMWNYDPAVRIQILARAGLSSELSEHWYERSFGEKPSKLPQRAA